MAVEESDWRMAHPWGKKNGATLWRRHWQATAWIWGSGSAGYGSLATLRLFPREVAKTKISSDGQNRRDTRDAYAVHEHYADAYHRVNRQIPFEIRHADSFMRKTKPSIGKTAECLLAMA
jgi:hypothetical protein